MSHCSETAITPIPQCWHVVAGLLLGFINMLLETCTGGGGGGRNWEEVA